MGLYRNKLSRSKTRILEIERQATEMESKLASFVRNAVRNLSTKFNTNILLSPLSSVAYDMQRHVGNINFQKIPSMEGGSPHVAACNKAFTRLFHSEQDFGYTFIVVPKQSFLTGNYHFCIKLNEMTITLQLKENIQIIFNAYLMTHRQICTNMQQRESSNFLNVFALSNKKLFRHIKIWKEVINHEREKMISVIILNVMIIYLHQILLF